MLRSLTLITALVLLAAPSAQAGWFDRDVSVTLAPEIAGDTMSYAIERAAPGMDAQKDAPRSSGMTIAFAQSGQKVIQVEGTASAVDAYGIARDTIAYRIDTTGQDGVVYSQRCHRLADGLATVRMDILGGASPLDEAASSKSAPARGDTMMRESFPATRFASEPCVAGLGLAGRTLREGDSLPLSLFDGAGDATLSAPASATTFEGRAALTFTFTRANGVSASYAVADGLPGIVRAIVAAPADAGEYRESVTLVGFEPGVGMAIAPPGDASLPARHPGARFAAPDPLVFDDAAFAPAFRYADAYAAIVADPTTRFSEWLSDHPDAVLALAAYDPHAREAGAVSVETDGAWTLGFASGSELRSFTIMRVVGASTPLGPLAAPTHTDRVTAQETRATEPVTLPAEIADGATLAALAVAQGVDPGALSSLAFVLGADFAYLDVASDAGDGVTRIAILDPTRGATLALMSTTKTEGGLLGFFEGGMRAPAKNGLAAIDAPTAIAAGGAATAGALVLLLFLLPLFTRLRRDRLLDNPIRARLYERVRAEPGIHRAELVDFAGIGEGATRHHLAQLAKHRLLVETHTDGFVRYFAAGEVPPEIARREAVLRAGSNRAVYDLYAREPGLSLRDAGARLGMSAPSVHRAKKKLETAGLLPAGMDTSNAVAEA